jgi:hypothetical protein
MDTLTIFNLSVLSTLALMTAYKMGEKKGFDEAVIMTKKALDEFGKMLKDKANKIDEIVNEKAE